MIGWVLTRPPWLVAYSRAEKLFLQHLSPEQLLSYRDHQTVPVLGKSGCQYKIYCGSIDGNITVFPPKRWHWWRWRYIAPSPFKICLITKDGLPMFDVLLAQKLALETNEKAARKLARYRGIFYP